MTYGAGHGLHGRAVLCADGLTEWLRVWAVTVLMLASSSVAGTLLFMMLL